MVSRKQNPLLSPLSSLNAFWGRIMHLTLNQCGSGQTGTPARRSPPEWRSRAGLGAGGSLYNFFNWLAKWYEYRNPDFEKIYPNLDYTLGQVRKLLTIN